MQLEVVLANKIGDDVYVAYKDDEKLVVQAKNCSVGDEVAGEFEIVQDPVYGKMYRLVNLKNIRASSYMKSLLTLTNIRYVGIATARKIIDQLGENAIDIIAKDPSVLNSISGIQKRQIESITHEVRLLKLVQIISAKVKSKSERTVVALAKMAMQRDLDRKIEESLAYLPIYIEGIDPRGLVDKSDELYLPAMVVYTLHRVSSAQKKSQLTSAELAEKLRTDVKRVQQALEILKDLGQVIQRGEDSYMLSSVAHAYGITTLYLRRNMNLNRKDSTSLEQEIKFQLDVNDKLNDTQKQAVLTALISKVSCITGGPGTGKSTTIEAIHRIGRSLGLDVVVLSTTGKSAQRLSSVGARTVHAHIAWDGVKENRRVEHDLVIIDEASMLDIHVFGALLRAIGDTAICLVGDVNQLPPVGCGAPFHTLVSMRDRIRVVELTQNYRNNDEIARLADAVLKRDVQLFLQYLRNGQTVKLVHSDDSDALLEKIKTAYRKAYEQYGLLELYERVLILSPYRSPQRSKLSSTRLNRELGVALGFDPNRWIQDQMKVVQCVNDYEKEVMNGEIGRVIWSNPFEVSIEYPNRQIQYNKIEADAMLDRALAMTVHKAQGSEADVCWFILEPNAYGMVDNRLFYTAITRARSKLAIFALEDAVSLRNLHAILGKDTHSVLDQQLMQEVIA